MLIGYRDFLDGKTRPVYVADDGSQYVLDDAGVPVYGEWIGPNFHSADTPFIRANLDDPPAKEV